MSADSTNSPPLGPNNPSAPPPSDTQQPLRVLVVEDDDAARIAIAYILQAAGFQVQQARNGMEALARTANGFDAILLDINMPMVDGIRALQTLRGRGEAAEAAVIMLTSHASRDCVQQCAALGADGFILKQSMEVDGLIERILNAILSRRERHALAALKSG